MIPINWKQNMMEEDLLDLISPIEYLPTRSYWEERGDVKTYIRAFCPIHGKSLFLNWKEIKNSSDHEEVFDIAIEDYDGWRAIYPLPTDRYKQDTVVFICIKCRQESGHQLSLLELFG